MGFIKRLSLSKKCPKTAPDPLSNDEVPVSSHWSFRGLYRWLVRAGRVPCDTAACHSFRVDCVFPHLAETLCWLDLLAWDIKLSVIPVCIVRREQTLKMGDTVGLSTSFWATLDGSERVCSTPLCTETHKTLRCPSLSLYISWLRCRTSTCRYVIKR